MGIKQKYRVTRIWSWPCLFEQKLHQIICCNLYPTAFCGKEEKVFKLSGTSTKFRSIFLSMCKPIFSDTISLQSAVFYLMTLRHGQVSDQDYIFSSIISLVREHRVQRKLGHDGPNFQDLFHLPCCLLRWGLFFFLMTLTMYNSCTG